MYIYIYNCTYLPVLPTVARAATDIPASGCALWRIALVDNSRKDVHKHPFTLKTAGGKQPRKLTNSFQQKKNT